MVQSLIVIRLKQLYRSLKDIGLLRFILLIAIITFLISALFIKSADYTNALYISLGFNLLILIIHIKRKDKLFLKSHFTNYKTLILAEYIILSAPVIAALLTNSQFKPLIIFISIALTINIDSKPQSRSYNSWLQRLIPNDSLEFKAGVRRYLIILTTIWTAGIAASFYTATVPVIMFIIGIIILSFYEQCEPLQILTSYELSAKKLMVLKIKRHIQIYTIVMMPLVILFTIFNHTLWYIVATEFFVLLTLHIYAITVKYALYKPNIKSQAAQTLVAIGAIGALIAPLLPLTIIMGIRFYIKSINNLNQYLNDYNR